MTKHAPDATGETITLNQRFLEALFGFEDWKHASVVTVHDHKTANWSSWPAEQWAGHLRPIDNNYFSVSLFDPPGARAKVAFKAMHVLALDDVVAKVDPARVIAALGQPAWRIETSPGSEHWGYILDPPVADEPRADRLIKRVIKGLYAGKDPGMKDVTRLMRMPEGRNTKPECGPEGFAVRLLRMPEAGFGTITPEAVEAALPMEGDGAPPQGTREGARAGGGTDDPVLGPMPSGPCRRPEDPVVAAMRSLGLLKSEHTRETTRGIGWDIVCPWADAHTPGTGVVDTGTMYFQGGGFKCWHGHCDARRPDDVPRRVEELLRADSGGLLGLDDLDPSRFDAVDPAAVPPSPVAPEPPVVQRFWAVTVYHGPAERFIDVTNDEELSEHAFNARWMFALKDFLPEGKKAGVKVSPAFWYLGGPKRRWVQARTWCPGEARVFTQTEANEGARRCLNLWRQPPRPGKAGADAELDAAVRASDWYALQATLFEASTPEGRANFEHWLDYQSLIVARVDIKPGHNPLFMGPQGVGKDILLRPLLKVLGPTRYRQIDQETLKGSFTDWIMNRLVILPEVYRPSRWDVKGRDEYAKIKALCDPGKPFIAVNEKYRGVIQAANVFILVMTSNEDKPLVLPADDRRVWVTRFERTGWRVRRYQRLAGWYDEASPFGGTNSDAVVEWLIRRHENSGADEQREMLARFTGHAPMTEAKRDLIELSRGDLEVWIEELLNRTLPDTLTLPDVFTAQDILERAENAASMGGYGLARNTSTGGAKAVGRILRKLGCVALNKEQSVPLPDGTQRRMWARPGDTIHAAMSEKQLKAWLDARRRA